MTSIRDFQTNGQKVGCEKWCEKGVKNGVKKAWRRCGKCVRAVTCAGSPRNREPRFVRAVRKSLLPKSGESSEWEKLLFRLPITFLFRRRLETQDLPSRTLALGSAKLTEGVCRNSRAGAASTPRRSPTGSISGDAILRSRGLRGIRKIIRGKRPRRAEKSVLAERTLKRFLW